MLVITLFSSFTSVMSKGLLTKYLSVENERVGKLLAYLPLRLLCCCLSILCPLCIYMQIYKFHHHSTSLQKIEEKIIFVAAIIIVVAAHMFFALCYFLLCGERRGSEEKRASLEQKGI